MAYNHVATDAMARIARALGVEGNAAVAMHQIARRLGAPMALRELGMPEAAIREAAALATANPYRSEEHTSELQSLMRISYAVFCLKKKIIYNVYTRIRCEVTIIATRP